MISNKVVHYSQHEVFESVSVNRLVVKQCHHFIVYSLFI